MKGVNIFLECLKKEGVDVIFGYPGGAVLSLYDVLNKQDAIRHVLVRHEQGASLAADGYARTSGKTGVCLSTSGPGATNMITGIANAHLDSVPMVAFTGQVAASLIGTDAFQEVDMVGSCMPFTKHVYQVFDANDLPRIVKEAFYIAGTGRKGPVLVDLPKNIFDQEVKEWNYPEEVDLPGYRPVIDGNLAQIKKAQELIMNSERPVVLAGHGVALADAEGEFKDFIAKIQSPFMSTLLAMDILPKSHELNLGMLGMHGQLGANLAVHNSDLVIGVGLRFDDRILGRIDDFAPNAKVVHIDIDRAEIGKNRVVDVPIVGDVKSILPRLMEGVKGKDHLEWINQIKNWNDEKNAKIEKIKHSDTLSARDVIRKISEMTKGQAVVAADVGQNQMWTANYYDFATPKNHLSSGGLGTMGYAMPAGMGAKIARPNDIVLSVCGDGGFQMNMQELTTLVQDDIHLKIIVLNNGYLGMVRQWQDLFYKKNYSFTDLISPDIPAVAKACGVESDRALTLQEVESKFQKALDHKGPYLLEVKVEREENVFPMVSPGASLSETRLN
ncbi:MAG: biosynthetic-type acetolactate synthase large subunit [Candidatus Gracilibacteria bacterium]|jgi:acetolactate synthase-1/2/3 large subunit|nr:biosynthetic-type acetolactate synthase large subunit [Candidatus Gracilibacteria bacterium]